MLLKGLLRGSAEASSVDFSFFFSEGSTPLMSNEGDSEQVVELHSTEPGGVHISLFCDREN